MGEIVQIYVGQAGVQIANACWELYCLENGICADGTLTDCPYDDTFKNIFYFKAENQVVPRAILVDSDPICIDQVQRSAYGCLYNPGCLICGKEDSGCLYPRGYGCIGSELIDVTMAAFNKVVESCCYLRGILIFRSVGGGTGSGLGNLIIDRLMEDYTRVSKMEFIIFPSESISPLTVEPYNAMLATHLSMDAIDCSFIMDNEALFDICATQLNKCSPRYQNLDRIIAQVSTTFTTSQRFGCHSGISFAEYQTNLIPYPRIHFPVVSYAPFIPEVDGQCASVTTEQITNACFNPCNQLVRCDPKEGSYMSCLLLYRGNATPGCIDASICNLKKCGAIHFVDWQPTDFKIGINTRPPFMVPSGGLGNSDKTVLALSSNTVIQKVWCRLVDKFNSIYCIRAYLHHYTAEGLEEDSFNEAFEDISALIADYQEVQMCMPEKPITKCVVRDCERQCRCKPPCQGSCCLTKDIVQPPPPCQLREIAKPICPTNIAKPIPTEICPTSTCRRPSLPKICPTKPPPCAPPPCATPTCAPAPCGPPPCGSPPCGPPPCLTPRPPPPSILSNPQRNPCYKCGQQKKVEVCEKKSQHYEYLPGCNLPGYSRPAYQVVRPQCHCQVLGGHHGKRRRHSANRGYSSDDQVGQSDQLNLSLPVRSVDESDKRR